MLRFIQAVNANARRYTNPESALNAGLSRDDVRTMLETSLHSVWSLAVSTLSGGVPMIQASMDGEVSRIRYIPTTFQIAFQVAVRVVREVLAMNSIWCGRALSQDYVHHMILWAIYVYLECCKTCAWIPLDACYQGEAQWMRMVQLLYCCGTLRIPDSRHNTWWLWSTEV